MTELSSIPITFNGTHFSINDYLIEFDPYYFALDGEDTGKSYLEIFIKGIIDWSNAIHSFSAIGQITYLPVGVFDQCINVLIAQCVKEETIVVRCGWADENGYAINLNDLTEYNSAQHNIIEAGKFGPVHIGDFDRSELLSSLESFIDKMRNRSLPQG
jgi:hypothetical protein